MAHDDPFFDELDLEPDDIEEDAEPLRPPWWRPLLVVVAAITALAMAAVPLYNVINRDRPVTDSGLQICGFDYCIVQEAAIGAGLNEEMSRLANTFLGDDEAREFARVLLDELGETNVSFVVVDRLDRDLKGQYDPTTRTILVERPVRAWIVLHEVAHTAAPGHGVEFQDVLIELARWTEATRPLD